MSDKKSEKLAEGTLISHLLELRDRLVRAMLAVILVFIPAAIFRNELFDFLAEPMLRQLHEGQRLITTGVMTPFTIPIKLAFFVAIFTAMPLVLYQLWAFVAPGLYRKEKRFAVPLLVSSIVLFYVGIAFAYYFVFPAAFKFFLHTTPDAVQNMPDINEYVDFALRIFFGFGVAFEVPVVVVLLTLTGLITTEKLVAARGYVIIVIFVIAAVLTPPDPLSQIMMAVPMWLLYEAGLLMAKIMTRGRKSEDPDKDDAAT